MPNLISIAATTIEVPSYPSRACSRTATRNRRQALKSALWSCLKLGVTLTAIFVKELIL